MHVTSSTIIQQALGTKLRNLRRKVGLTHFEAADQLGVVPGSTVLWESAQRPVGRDEAEHLLRVYQASVVDQAGFWRLFERTAGPGIFLSYRRVDAGYASMDLAKRLRARFGTECVFRDEDSISPGAGWRGEIEEALDTSAVVLVLIGPAWLTASEQGGRRLDDPTDLVRREVVRALELGRFVVPVLIDGGVLPRADDLPAAMADLCGRHAARLRNGTADADCDTLMKRIAGHLALR